MIRNDKGLDAYRRSTKTLANEDDVDLIFIVKELAGLG